MFVQRFFACKKNEKKQKKGGPSGLHGEGRRSCGGRREGKEGKPFRDRRLNASIQNHASTPLGYGEFTTLRETAAPATEGQDNRGETQTVEQQPIRNWAKLGTELEQKQKATNDQSNA